MLVPIRMHPVQTPESIKRDFDRIAALSDDAWNHNDQYHQFLLCHVPHDAENVCEIGCGTGKFSRRLAARSEQVLAIDLSPLMIRLARERSDGYRNIDFVEGDFMTLEFPDSHFDFVGSLTTLHHLPTEACLRKIKRLLKPNGVFACLDLYQRSKVTDLFFDCVAFPVGVALSLIKTGKPRAAKEIRDAYAEHATTDEYLTLPEIRRICSEIMPGAVIKRHLLWRYSLVWRKEKLS